MKEREIRPQELLNQYLELCAKDATSCFNQVERHDLACIGCASHNTTFAFEKHGFAYAYCDDCGTLYQTPRPTIESFEKFYRDSQSSRYWAEVFFPAVTEVRREKIFRPRVELLTEFCRNQDIIIDRLIDIGAGFGVFLDEWRHRFPDTEVVAVEPSSSLATECRRKGLRVVESTAENVSGLEHFADLVVCFEVLEHVHDPFDFVKILKRMTRPDGYVMLSTLCIDGFDLQLLWDKSSQISPPQHINFFSVQGFKSLFERVGLVDVKVTTPGQLDVDIVRNFAATDSTLLAQHRFLDSVLGSDKKARSFQAFLAANQLSSHAWVFGRNPDVEDSNG